MKEKTATPKTYMNTRTRAVYYAKPQHADNPVMIPYYGEMPPVGKNGLCCVPEDDLGPAFAAEEGDVTKKKEPDKTVKEPMVIDIEKIAAAIGDLKKFDFTSAGIPKVDKLSLAVGHPVTGKQRDDAFALWIEMNEITEE